MIFYAAPLLADAREAALEAARLHGEVVIDVTERPDTFPGIETAHVTGTVPVVRADNLKSVKVRKWLAALARDGAVFVYGAKIPEEFADFTSARIGTTTVPKNYKALRDAGHTDRAATKAVSAYGGDNQAASAYLTLLQNRRKVLATMDAIRSRDLGTLLTLAENVSHRDVNVVLRSVLNEAETGLVAWTEEEVEPILSQVDFVRRVLGTRFVVIPGPTWLAVMVGLYVAWED